MNINTRRAASGVNINDKAIHIAIAGGGVSGVATLAHLNDYLPPTQRTIIHLIDPKAFDGAGVPYSAPRDKPATMIEAWRSLMLNVPAHMMLDQIAINQGFDFVNWLTNHYPNYGAKDFTPRHVFGEFMRDGTKGLRAAIAKKPNITLVDHHHSLVRAEQLSAAKIHLTLENTSLIVDHLFTAIGHQRSSVLEAVEGKPGYCRTPYNMGKFLPKGNADCELLVYGGVATIIDTIQLAEKLGYAGKYTIVSAAAEFLDTFSPQAFPSSHKTFCRLRDFDNRMVIHQGHVECQEINYDDSNKYLAVPFLRYFGDRTEPVTLYAANVINAAIWERTITYTASHYFDPNDYRVHHLHSDIMTNPLFTSCYNEDLITRDEHDMARANHSGMHIVGSPLTVAPGDKEQRMWSAMHCWRTADREVAAMCAPLNKPMHFNWTPVQPLPVTSMSL